MKPTKRRCLALQAGLFLLLVLPLFAQRVDPLNLGHRVWVLDKVITNAQGVRMPAHAQGKLAFVALYSPDGSRCLAEYVAKNDRDLDSLRQDAARDATIRIFDKHLTRQEVFAALARAVGFTQLDLDRFFVRTR